MQSYPSINDVLLTSISPEEQVKSSISIRLGSAASSELRRSKVLLARITTTTSHTKSLFISSYCVQNHIKILLETPKNNEKSYKTNYTIKI